MDTRPLAPGTRIRDRYRVVRLVAGGGMAWVYEVDERLADGTSRTWAMKELRPGTASSATLAEARQLFAQEANILVRLSHPHLPRVVAYLQEDGRSYLVMEFLHGESLEKRLENANAPLLEHQVLDWAVQVCEVLAYLHRQPRPIIFRDLKPSNIMVTEDGAIKLIDFGIARTYKAGQRKDTVTMGSENYAAPEQWGEAQTDPRADIYGLGATLYHLLANVPPLPAFVPAERVPLARYNAAVSEATSAVIERAMAPDRHDRYACAQEMRAALLECLPRRERRRAESRALAGRQPADGERPDAADSGGGPPTDSPEAPLAATAQERRAQQRPSAGPEGGVCFACGALNRAVARYCRQCGRRIGRVPQAMLKLVEPSAARWEYPLSRSVVLVGRRGGAQPVDLDVGYYDPEGYVSRNHARVACFQERYHVIDLDSANGTYVNGERLVPRQPRRLASGDRILLGQIVLALLIC